MITFADVVSIQIFWSVCVFTGAFDVLWIVRLVNSFVVKLTFVAFEVRVKFVVRHLIHA